jgi:hypothetical protein
MTEQTSTEVPHVGALNEPETCPPSENVTSALPVTVEPMAVRVMVPELAKDTLGVAEQSPVFAANAWAMTFPCALGVGNEVVMGYVPGWSGAAVPPILMLPSSSVKTVEFALVPQVRFCDDIREQSPWKLLKRAATPVTLAVRLETVQLP